MWFRVVETITRVIFFENQFGSRAGKKIKGLLYRPSPFTSESGILVRRRLLGVVENELSGVITGSSDCTNTARIRRFRNKILST